MFLPFMGIVKENGNGVIPMTDTYMDMPTRMAESFPEIENDILMDLSSASPEYIELQDQLTQLRTQHPFISAVLQKTEPVQMTAEEHHIFLRYLSLTRQVEDMERLQIYFRGHQDAVAYLKKIKAI